LMLVFGFLWQNYFSKLAHDKVLKGTPVIGTSFTDQARAASIKAFAQQIAQRTTPPMAA